MDGWMILYCDSTDVFSEKPRTEKGEKGFFSVLVSLDEGKFNRYASNKIHFIFE